MTGELQEQYKTITKRNYWNLRMGIMTTTVPCYDMTKVKLKKKKIPKEIFQ